MKLFAVFAGLSGVALVLVPGCGVQAQAESACDALIEAESSYESRCGAKTEVHKSGFREYCINLLAANGTNADAAVACAKAKVDLPCDLDPRVEPACANKVVGTLADGLACRFDIQCGSGHCKGADLQGSACGVCAQEGPPGSACASDAQCEKGLVCARSASGPGVCVTPRDSGASCGPKEASPVACAAGLACVVEAAGSAATCRRQGGTGDTCGAGMAPCGGAQTCIAGRCALLPRTGEPCVDACAGQDVCKSGTCVTPSLRAAGDACNVSALDLCDDQSFCDAGRCKARRAPGETCTAQDRCVSHHVCSAGVCVLPDARACN
jgi:hypothetical protein